MAIPQWMALLVVLAMTGPQIAAGTSCRVSQFFCDTGQCVALDRYCDGADDCGDKSDEPRYCSPCNRTYFGDVGRTYELEIRRPREDRLPFLCHLNFTAGGGDLGDLIQLTFDTFTVGQFVSFTTEGCPDGHMTIREMGRPSTGGQWCGSAWGYTVYYSESTSLNLTLELYRLSEQLPVKAASCCPKFWDKSPEEAHNRMSETSATLDNMTRPSPEAKNTYQDTGRGSLRTHMGIGYNFDFKLAYKFLRHSEARLRYGNSTTATWRGELVPGTYCDRILDRCDMRSCRIQSPNFPGVYPRNVTCHYRVEQTQVPRGKHILLAVRQRNSHKIHIKDQVVKYDRSQRVLRVWDQCNVVQDYLTVYDGSSITDPVLVRLCGGDVVPDIVSSGPSMLLEFHTSPFDNPFHPVPLSYLPGFELEVQVMFLDSDSQTYVPREGRNCEFLLTSFDSTRGELGTPHHSLPPNTTCRYHFQGRRQHEMVWVSFIKYQVADLAMYEQCNARLRIWDGRYDEATPMAIHGGKNATLVGEFCKDEVPRLCDHTLLTNSTRVTRPCSLAESYVSTGSELTIELSLRQGSALYPVSFLLRYEFVDTSQEGVPLKPSSPKSCDRLFTSGSGRFQSPRSVFLYGRGGAQNLSCILRFETNRGGVRLTVNRAKFGDRKCKSHLDSRTGRWQCVPAEDSNGGVAQLRVSEFPWPGVRLPRDCICSGLSEPLILTTLGSSVIEINFTVTFMNITHDFHDFFFEGEYKFLRNYDEGGACPTSREERRLRGSSGEIALRSPGNLSRKNTMQTSGFDEIIKSPVPSCVNHPWLIEPEDPINSFLYLKVRGFELVEGEDRRCGTLNRIVVYCAGQEPRVIVCPREEEVTADFTDRTGSMVEVFSEGWNHTSGPLEPPHARSFVVEFLEREPGSYAVTWMEVSRRPLLGASSSYVMASVPPPECPHRCPELNACISAALWCDGSRHCPSGYDEEDVNCAASLYHRVPLLYVLIGACALGVLTLLIAVSTAYRRRSSKKRRRKKKKTASSATAANHHLHINHNGYSPSTHHAPDVYGKDSLC